MVSKVMFSVVSNAFTEDSFAADYAENVKKIIALKAGLTAAELKADHMPAAIRSKVAAAIKSKRLDRAGFALGIDGTELHSAELYAQLQLNGKPVVPFMGSIKLTDVLNLADTLALLKKKGVPITPAQMESFTQGKNKDIVKSLTASIKEFAAYKGLADLNSAAARERFDKMWAAQRGDVTTMMKFLEIAKKSPRTAMSVSPIPAALGKSEVDALTEALEKTKLQQDGKLSVYQFGDPLVLEKFKALLRKVTQDLDLEVRKYARSMSAHLEKRIAELGVPH